MTIQDLLKECEYEYDIRNFKKLNKLTGKVLKIEPENPIAISYNAISYCFLNQPQKALEILNEAVKIHPNNYYHKNIAAMAYYDLGEYEKSLKCCEEGLKIKSFDWLFENKIKALLKLNRTDEAMECYENGPVTIEIIDLLIEAGKYLRAFEYCLEADIDEYESIIDEIKENDSGVVGDYYLSWIYNIKSKSNIRLCPDCGGELIPIMWGFPHGGLFEKVERGEIFLGGCCIPINPPNYHCKNCGSEFDLGVEGLHVECEDYKLNDYTEYKIRELTSKLKKNSMVAVKSFETLKKQLRGFDDNEFNEFINHLKDLDYLFEPCEGYVKLTGFDDLKCMKEYCDEGKYAAPRWLVYPQLSLGTMGWRMGDGENYWMNLPYHDEEIEDLFPMPKYWKFSYSKSQYRPHYPLGYFWRENGKPEYPNTRDGIRVNDFITLTDEGKFTSDLFTFNSIEYAILLSKALYFEKYPEYEDFQELKDLKELKDIEYTPDEEKTWEIYRYSVLLNASYFKIMTDEELKQKLLDTGDEPLIYVSDDEENLFGRVLMEIRDEIRRLYQNEDKIDWEYTEYLKNTSWLCIK